MSRWGRLLSATVATAVLVVVVDASGGAVQDASAAAKPSAAMSAYCAQVKQVGDAFGDPGIDAIFDNNPNPTLAQWAAFLPGPIARMRTFADDVEAIHPPKVVAADAALVVKRLRAVADFFDHERALAAAGDQRAFDAAGDGRDALVKKLGKAMGKVQKACGFKDGSKQ